MKEILARDEREAAIDRAGDRLAYVVLSYGILAAVAYRGFVGNESSWDLLALVVGAGVIGLAYRTWRGAVTGGVLLVLGVTIAVAAAVAAVLAVR
jgi:hypothetical protein